MGYVARTVTLELKVVEREKKVGEMQQNAFLSLDFLQIQTGTSFIGESNKSRV